jgi:hypothetical protein
MGDQVTSLNEFKRESGAFGFVQGVQQNAVAGVQLILFRKSTNEIMEVDVTDDDGYYVTHYKHTGPPEKFTLVAMQHGLSQEFELHGNGRAEVNFDLNSQSVSGTWVSAKERGKRK